MGRTEEVFRCTITERLELVSNEPITILRRHRDLPWVILETKRPLVVLLVWMEAQPEHVDKYVNFYLAKTFDVLLGTTTIWQVLWNSKGSLATASHLVDFLHEHEYFQPLIIHGLSVGNAMWSLAEEKMFKDEEKYKGTIDSVKAQICDSCPMNPSLARSITFSLFQEDTTARRIAEWFLKLVLFVNNMFVRSCYNHCIHLLKNPRIKVPRLMFISKDDPIAHFDENMRALENWNLMGIKAKVKWWKNSPHVGHFAKHKAEYIEEVENLLTAIGLFYKK